jgi:hypothetical protein
MRRRRATTALAAESVLFMSQVYEFSSCRIVAAAVAAQRDSPIW